ncbi:hypothetical protein SNEBB_000192 [Seison nebaliae]|nr:hypothetical protein SNEBB_000192 [Seison nebaliae]
MASWATKLGRNCNITSAEFTACWKCYDKDGNGYIDGTELDDFFRDLVRHNCKEDVQLQSLIEKVKHETMSTYDINQDGRIDIAELAKILPTEESFLTIFHYANNNCSEKDFMKIWKKYARTNLEYITSDELQSFLRDILQESGKTTPQSKLDEYSRNIIELYDVNKDGKLSFKELKLLLPDHTNPLLVHKNAQKISREDFSRLFSHYDKNSDGCIADKELSVFLQDLAELFDSTLKSDKKNYDLFCQSIMKACDISGDNKLQEDEVALWLGVVDD